VTTIECVIILQETRPVQRYDHIIGKWKTSLHSGARSALKLVSIAAALLLAYLIIDLIEDAAVGEGWMIIVPQLTNFSQAMVSGVIQTISGSGYYGIFLLMFLESISLPIPSEVILPFSGYLVSRGLLDFWNVLVLTTLAGVAGAIVDYTIGYRLTRQESLTLRGHKLIGTNQFKIAQNWFERYGSIAVFLARMVDATQVNLIARFISNLNPEIPYSLLLFHSDFYMSDMPFTSKRQLESCLKATKKHLRNVHVDNIGLLGM